jgi:hypothetical protein
MTYNSSEEQDVKSRKTKRELQEERCDKDLEHLLSDEGSRYFIWRLLQYCRMFSSTSLPDHHMAVQSGMRDVGIWLFNEIERVDIDAFHKMHKEALIREGKIDE